MQGGEQRGDTYHNTESVLWVQLKSLNYKRREDSLYVSLQTPLRLSPHHHAWSYVSSLTKSWFPSSSSEQVEIRKNNIELIEKWMPSTAQLEIIDLSVCYVPSLASRANRVPCARICLGQMKVLKPLIY